MNKLQHDGARSSLIYGDRIRTETLSISDGFSFDVVSTLLENTLGKHAKVADERDAIGENGLNGREALAASFDFNEVGTGFAEPAGVLNGQRGSGATAGRKVGGDQRLRHPARHGTGVVNHIRHRNLRGVGMAQHDHAKRVAHQEKIKPAIVKEAGGGVIVGRERSKATARCLSLAE